MQKKVASLFFLLASYNIQKKYHKAPLKSYRSLLFCFVLFCLAARRAAKCE